ncbi:MerR family transcriptional regulator [Nocardia terrae]|uniref:MerR family transcriptional regulator n=1 Tax=Nocardia terrae TaxID=2675851 RepID=UPI0018DF9014|nr:MerR family transcriptional regulator [Nocardia terrae]
MTDDTQPDALLSIGELARASGLPVRTIRFYCDEGILESHRSPGGHRLFDADSATERLVLVKRLRALGLGLGTITEVLHGTLSIPEAITAESARLDLEFRSLAWRRASLRAIESAAPSHRSARLALLAAAQEPGAAHDCLIRYWRRILAPLPTSDVERWVCGNVPEPPTNPSAADVLAYAELAALAADPTLKTTVRNQYWRHAPESIRDRHRLFNEVGDVISDLIPLVSTAAPPTPGNELDRFVQAHATARGENDSPRFRKQLHTASPTPDPRTHRFWTLTHRLLGTDITVGPPHDWLCAALTISVNHPTTHPPNPAPTTRSGSRQCGNPDNSPR